jgi:hypothetical protein
LAFVKDFPVTRSLFNYLVPMLQDNKLEEEKEEKGRKAAK